MDTKQKWNAVISEMMEAEETIMERVEHKKLQWHGHVKRMENDRLPKTIVEWETEGRYSMEKYGLRVEDTTNREEWRRKIFH
jgi:hypothetical protein